MATGTAALITGAAADFTTQALVVLAATIAIGVGLVVFYFGWRKLRGVPR